MSFLFNIDKMNMCCKKLFVYIRNKNITEDKTHLNVEESNIMNRSTLI